MRTVSFSEHLEFECNGSISSKAISIADVDNDKKNELLIGTVDGCLCIHKGSDPNPWRKCEGLGKIMCLSVGDVCNQEKTYVVVLDVEGWCNLFLVKPNSTDQDTDESCRILKPIHQQHLVSNAKTMLVADINCNGRKEMVVGFSDRKVRCYRWAEGAEPDINTTTSLGGRFHLIDTWELAGQLGSLSVNRCSDGTVDLMVSQPGGTFVTLLRSGHPPNQKTQLSTSQAQDNEPSTSKDPHLLYHPLGMSRASDNRVTTEIIANISRSKIGGETFKESYFAICTLDGTLTLVDNTDTILWSLHVAHQLFSLTKLDVTGDGIEEVVACSWDGHTYIVNLKKEVVRFVFPENVAAFCAGYYALSDEDNRPCFIYATFNNKVHVYYSIELKDIKSTDLIAAMANQSGSQELLTYFNVDANKRSQVQQLYHWCLYGMHCINATNSPAELQGKINNEEEDDDGGKIEEEPEFEKQ